MRHFASISLMLLAILVGACFSACTFHEDMDSESCPKDGLYLKLHIDFGSGTRATGDPHGGEDGDGREAAHFNERTIDNLCFFIYNDGGNLFNDAGDAVPFKYKKFIEHLGLSGADSYDTTPILVNGYHPSNGDRIVVVVNLGDCTSYNTIGDLRTAEVEKEDAWKSAALIKDYSLFAMSSSTDDIVKGKVYVDGGRGEFSNPYYATVDVERIAARVDWVLPLDGFGNPLVDADGAKYLATEAGSEGTLYLTDVRLVNESRMSTYLIRRISPQVQPALGGVTYMGKVDVDGAGLPTTYVVEPLTIYKNKFTPPSPSNYETWYGASSFLHSKEASFFATSDYNVYANATASAMPFTVGGQKCYTIGYLMENTMDKSLQTNDTRTGVELRCTFVPTTVYECTTVGGTESPVAYSKGNDFWYYEDKTDRTKSKFFLTETDFDNYAYGKSDYVKRKYTKGVCYYYIWLHHAMYDEIAHSGKYPMEYAIVRNNIYRIDIEQVLSIGTPTPDPIARELIKVRKWNLREQKPIRL